MIYILKAKTTVPRRLPETTDVPDVPAAIKKYHTLKKSLLYSIALEWFYCILKLGN
jgi:hypothetical protein